MKFLLLVSFLMFMTVHGMGQTMTLLRLAAKFSGAVPSLANAPEHEKAIVWEQIPALIENLKLNTSGGREALKDSELVQDVADNNELRSFMVYALPGLVELDEFKKENALSTLKTMKALWQKMPKDLQAVMTEALPTLENEQLFISNPLKFTQVAIQLWKTYGEAIQKMSFGDKPQMMIFLLSGIAEPGKLSQMFGGVEQEFTGLSVEEQRDLERQQQKLAGKIPRRFGKKGEKGGKKGMLPEAEAEAEAETGTGTVAAA